MEFQTKAQQACYEKVAGYMKELYGEQAQKREDAPVFEMWRGSTGALTFVDPWGENDAAVRTRAYVVQGTELTPELLRHLLELNAGARFGGFGVDPNGDIIFQHALVGSTCDKEELRASVMAVMDTADEYDDVIVSRWGGQRARERTA